MGINIYRDAISSKSDVPTSSGAMTVIDVPVELRRCRAGVPLIVRAQGEATGRIVAVRRELEALHASGKATQEATFVNVLREKLDKLAEKALAVPSDVFKHIQQLEDNK